MGVTNIASSQGASSLCQLIVHNMYIALRISILFQDRTSHATKPKIDLKKLIPYVTIAAL